jgi:sulfur-carrier protein
MKVNLYANFRQLAGAKSVEIDLPNGSSLPQLLDCLLTLHPALRAALVDHSGLLLPHVHVFINGRDTQYLPEGTSLLLTPSDKIDMFPPVGGG